MTSSVRLSECLHGSLGEFRESDSGVLVEEATCKGAWVPPVLRRLSQVPAVSIMTSVLVFLISLVSTCLFSLMVRMHPTEFPAGPLTPVQLTAFSLCFTAVALHASNCVHAWMRCSHETAAALRALSELSVYLLLLFICDRTTLLPRRPRQYDGDAFGFLVLASLAGVLVTARRVSGLAHDGAAAAAAGSSSSVPPPAPPSPQLPPPSLPSPPLAPPPVQPAAMAWLNRCQLEEWLGWQQLLFMACNYFDNTALDRPVRVTLSAFTFVSGVVSYRHFAAEMGPQQGVVLLLRLLWRLNAFVVAACAVLRDQYMLYHLFAELSLILVVVYALTQVGPGAWRTERTFAVKVGFVALLCCVLWDLPVSPALFRTVWSPLLWLVRYDNPILKVEPLHEWQFRTRQDHWIWLVGVVVGHHSAAVDRLLRRLDAGERVGALAKVAVACVAALLLAGFAAVAFHYDTVTYTLFLPYTSWVPIVAYAALRNVFARLRWGYVPACAFVGSFAMEAYVVQTHMFMATPEANGKVLYTLRLLPGEYPMCDFALLLGGVVWVSYRVRAALPLVEQFVLPKQASLVAILENQAVVLCVLTGTYGFHAAWCALNFAASPP